MFKLDLLPTQEIIKKDTENGRVYCDEAGNSYPSVTTVIGSMSDKTWLNAWKMRVGNEEAERISKIARNRGTLIHKYLEEYVLGNELPNDILPDKLQLLQQYQRKMEKYLGNVRGIELPLISKKLKIAGTVDLIAEWRGVPSIIDFKTSNSLKRELDIYDYFLQVTLYSLMLEEMYGLKYRGLVILIGSHDVVECMEFLKSRDTYEYAAKNLIERYYINK